MSYSFDMDGLDLFSSPFSAPVRTAPPRPQAARPRENLPGATQRNTTPTASARRIALPSQKTPPLSRQASAPQQKPPTVKSPEPVPAAPAPIPDEKPAPKAVTPVSAPVQAAPTKQESVDSPKAPANTTPAAPQKELVLDMSSGTGTAPVDDAARRKAHEEAEAKRKADFDERQRIKKQAEKDALQKLNAMSDADIIAAAAKRVSTDTERLTRRNMKEAVAEHIQTLCKENPAFAKKVMYPSKNMIQCFSYIYRMARDFLQEEIEFNGIKFENGIGGDVPDAICLQWACDYFDNPVAEDHKDEETFVPKPYVPAPSKKSKPAKKSDKKPKKQQNKPSDSYEQMSLEGVTG